MKEIVVTNHEAREIADALALARAPHCVNTGCTEPLCVYGKLQADHVDQLIAKVLSAPEPRPRGCIACGDVDASPICYDCH